MYKNIVRARFSSTKSGAAYLFGTHAKTTHGSIDIFDTEDILGVGCALARVNLTAQVSQVLANATVLSKLGVGELLSFRLVDVSFSSLVQGQRFSPLAVTLACQRHVIATEGFENLGQQFQITLKLFVILQSL